MSTDVRAWRDALTRRRQKAATVSFKLAVVRAFFGYLVALGLIEKNPADAKLVLPPTLPEDMAGRALTPEEVWKVLTGPDRRKPEGARTAIKEYLKLDDARRRNLHSNGDDACLFQPSVNYRTLEFDKPLSTRMANNIVARWGSCRRMIYEGRRSRVRSTRGCPTARCR